jgi:hypothetical protein
MLVTAENTRRIQHLACGSLNSVSQSYTAMPSANGHCHQGGTGARLAALTPPGHKALIHLTLADEYSLAQAQVIIEARNRQCRRSGANR